jgi:dihydrofolate reductase
LRKLVVTQNTTLDGVNDAAGGWLSPGDRSGELAEVTSVLQQEEAAADALLLGRITFEEVRGFWLHQADDTTRIADYLNQVQEYVVSSTPTDPEWSNTRVPAGAAVQTVQRLKHETGRGHRCRRIPTLCLDGGDRHLAPHIPQRRVESRPVCSRPSGWSTPRPR